MEESNKKKGIPVRAEFQYYWMAEMQARVELLFYHMMDGLSDRAKERISLLYDIHFRENLISGSKIDQDSADQPSLLIDLQNEINELRSRLSELDSSEEGQLS